MYKKIAVVYNESPAGERALASAISLARILGSGLRVISVLEPPPAYTAYIAAVDFSAVRDLLCDRRVHREQLLASARETGLRAGIDLSTNLLEGEEVSAIVRFLLEDKTELLVVGLRRHEPQIARLWSRVYEMALSAPCTILGVH